MVTMLELIFHFKGADMELPLENYMLIDGSTGNLCLPMELSGDGSIIGSFQHRHHRSKMANIPVVLLVLLPLILSSLVAATHSDGGFGFQATFTHVDTRKG
jgi:hypothetical protein